MTLTDLIAIIGCVTGVVSLSFAVYQLLRERVMIKFDISEDRTIYFHKFTPATSKVSVEYSGIITVTIINKSSLPISIYDIEFINQYKHKLTNHIYPFDCLPFGIEIDKITNQRSSSLLLQQYQIILPKTLNPFDALVGYFYFDNFESNNENEETLKIIIKSARKRNIKTKCKIKYLDTKDIINYDKLAISGTPVKYVESFEE